MESETPFLLSAITSLILPSCIVIGSIIVATRVGWQVSMPMLTGSIFWLLGPVLMLPSSTQITPTPIALISAAASFLGQLLFLAGLLSLYLKDRIRTRTSRPQS